MLCSQYRHIIIAVTVNVNSAVYLINCCDDAAPALIEDELLRKVVKKFRLRYSNPVYITFKFWSYCREPIVKRQ